MSVTSFSTAVEETLGEELDGKTVEEQYVEFEIDGRTLRAFHPTPGQLVFMLAAMGHGQSAESRNQTDCQATGGQQAKSEAAKGEQSDGQAAKRNAAHRHAADGQDALGNPTDGDDASGDALLAGCGVYA